MSAPRAGWPRTGLGARPRAPHWLAESHRVGQATAQAGHVGCRAGQVAGRRAIGRCCEQAGRAAQAAASKPHRLPRARRGRAGRAPHAVPGRHGRTRGCEGVGARHAGRAPASRVRTHARKAVGRTRHEHGEEGDGEEGEEVDAGGLGRGENERVLGLEWEIVGNQERRCGRERDGRVTAWWVGPTHRWWRH
jgi:hypothetical protein